MCPVRSVTYVSGRSSRSYLGLLGFHPHLSLVPTKNLIRARLATSKFLRSGDLIGFGVNLFGDRVQQHKLSPRTKYPGGANAKSGVCSSGDAFVAMMESANLWDLHDSTHRLRLNRSADWRVLAQ
jgi:hypothetical protein